MKPNASLNIDLTKLNHTFQTKPLLIGGMAMEYYQLRQTGDDIDFVVSSADYEGLAQQYPEDIKDLFGDLGVCILEFELWQSIMLFGYDFLAVGAIEVGAIKIISLEKLLFLKTLGISEEKNQRDVKLIVEKIQNIQYGKDPTYDKHHFQW